MTERAVDPESLYGCFAAAEEGANGAETAESFLNVEEYENAVMYPEFSRWARLAGYSQIADLFQKVAGEEGQHAEWLRELYADIGAPKEGEDTRRAKAAVEEIRQACERLAKENPHRMVEEALKVSIRVEVREFQEIYPRFRDQALAQGDERAARVYQRVIDSERQHAEWYSAALREFRARQSN